MNCCRVEINEAVMSVVVEMLRKRASVAETKDATVAFDVSDRTLLIAPDRALVREVVDMSARNAPKALEMVELTAATEVRDTRRATEPLMKLPIEAMDVKESKAENNRVNEEVTVTLDAKLNAWRALAKIEEAAVIADVKPK
jgi:hypothetical protein